MSNTAMGVSAGMALPQVGLLTVVESRDGRCPECNYLLGHNKPHAHGDRRYIWSDRSSPDINPVMDHEARMVEVERAKARALLSEYDRA